MTLLFKKYSVAILAFVFFCCTLLVFYPGGMSGDSLGQWRQVVTGDINTWFPPAMVYMWKLWGGLFYGPFAMLFFHSLTYWIAVYLVVVHLCQRLINRIILLVIIGFFPPTWLMLSTVWKDVSMMVSFLLASTLVIYCRRKRYWSLIAIGLFFVLYGASVRHNAVLAILPLLYLFAERILVDRGIPSKLLTTLVLFFAMLSAIYCINTYKVTRTYYVSNMVYFWDLWGMSIDQGRNLMPGYLFHRKDKISLDELKKYYKPYCNTVIWPTETGLRGDRWTKSFPDKKFKKDFVSAIIKYPESYIKVRARVTGCLLGITCNNSKTGYAMFIQSFDDKHYLKKYSDEFAMSPFITIPKWYHQVTNDLFIFKSWIYLLVVFGISLLGFVKSIMKDPEYRIAILIAYSGLLYWMPYIIVAPCKDFRYNSWLIMSALLSSIIMICRKVKS